MGIFQDTIKTIEQKGAVLWILMDPDAFNPGEIKNFVRGLETQDIDAILVGGSLLIHGDYDNRIKTIREHSSVPVILFPGSLNQITPNVDALLFLSIISGRNPNYLIGEQVIAAPIVKQLALESISTGYMLIESGNPTTAEFMSDTRPIPRHKPEIAVAHALAAQYMGMSCVYLEAGSGADNPVPDEMVRAVSSSVNIPVIVGGGIRDAETAHRKVQAGAGIIVIGNVIEETKDLALVSEFSKSVHYKLMRS